MTDQLEKYRVEDLVVDLNEVRVVLLLESPFTDEIAHRHPLAGSSGRCVARFLVDNISAFSTWDRRIPIGCQLSCRGYASLALLNCSNYPLDSSAYCPNDYARDCQRVEGWDLLRRNPTGAMRRIPLHQELEGEMVASLKLRLSRMPEEALIVPCGNLARTFLRKCDLKRLYTCPIQVPHPSRNSWASPGNFGDFSAFSASLNRHLPGPHRF